MKHSGKSLKSSSYQGPWRRLAGLISEGSNPLFVALPTFLVVALASAPDVHHALLWWGVAVVGISLAPFLFVLRGVLLGHFSDLHVSERSQRLSPLLFGLGCISGSFVLLLILHASRLLLATVTSVIIVLVIATVITRAWKISLHLVGAAGAVTVFVLMFGPLFLLLSPLVGMVAWARWRVGAHTLLQAVAGTVLAVGVTVTLFWVFAVL